MNKRRMPFRSLRLLVLSGIALLICSAASADDRVQDRPKVRAITAFVRLTPSDYKRELAETVDA